MRNQVSNLASSPGSALTGCLPAGPQFLDIFFHLYNMVVGFSVDYFPPNM